MGLWHLRSDSSGADVRQDSYHSAVHRRRRVGLGGLSTVFLCAVVQLYVPLIQRLKRVHEKVNECVTGPHTYPETLVWLWSCVTLLEAFYVVLFPGQGV